jgi:transcription elongation factor GreA
MSKVKYYTKEGLKKIKEELHYLKTVKRPFISNQIADARDKGDLSENAEYSAAKEEQGLLETKINKLQEIYNNARIIDKSKIDNSKVLLFSTVKIKNINTNTVRSYTLVHENEVNIKSGKISVNSPVAKGLLGKSIGDKIKIKVPAGIIPFEIIDINI